MRETIKEIKTKYERWIERADSSLQNELMDLANDQVAMEDAFLHGLVFGTGGLRGTLGVGTNRMNVHTVARATQGLTDYLKANFEKPSVAIARDSRHMGKEFCWMSARVFVANGVRVYLYPRIEPTPALSFAVRHLHCTAGVCVTASHNPKDYNGYKIYGADGCQITTETAYEIQNAIENVDEFDDVKALSWDAALNSGLINWIGEECIDAYLDSVAEQSLDISPSTRISVVYTPLNGTGQECVGRILDRIGNVDVTLVPEQSYHNGNFPSCECPNPENREALQCGLDLCDKLQSDLLLATDPDCDRLGIAVRHAGTFELLNGNEVGVLLTDYVARIKRINGEDLKNSVLLTSIVSSDMVEALAFDYGFQMRRTLTGFKFIGEQIGFLEKDAEIGRFMLGFEESYGYLKGSYVRDKDAVVASMLICQMARWYKSQGLDLVDVMRELYDRYGYYRNILTSVTYSSTDGVDKMHELFADLRRRPPKYIAGLEVEQVVDYGLGLPMPILNRLPSDEGQRLPPSDVLEFCLSGDNKLIMRPSGTEPKAKAYVFVKGSTADEASTLLKRLKKAAGRLLTPHTTIGDYESKEMIR
ncbi:phosphoglucomutase/phosphomannomutase alpha/beta/alpha domain I [Coriobacterium glomerans PW2]|uniref:Phosphoglucomutase/phosphomannomutase alpha/beta/alpha domain I n=1 Tax=Coriobacterium glomerans (strain ATCC 49209 / DSM 20642 / JCM 10262 / PW2) TaxID=700015 RepID=F2N8B6_CORGP|nr:phospho-sugar mutase [Coriobacterium glomerans]AEB07299.1 phosphoglucomutase/phosphomannomutase alpha/beta/alpha domain I [Coriobacterium glomerans PW2]